MKTKNPIIFLFAIFLHTMLFIKMANAQPPQAISFQAVARNASNNVLANQNIALRFTIHDLTSGGATLYQETQSTTTNSIGLFSVSIGLGVVVSGNFATINWGTGNKFVQIDLDAAGGATFVTMGTQQLMSVPYSLYSGGSTGSWSILGNSNIIDGTNFLGTTNNIPLNFKVFNQKAGRIENTGANTFLGYQSGNVNTGAGSTAIGHLALSMNTVGANNVAVGVGAMLNNVGGQFSVAVGYQSQYYANSVATLTNSWNTSIGYKALRGSTTPANNVGIFNTAAGAQSMNSNASGSYNCAFGMASLAANTSGSFNSAGGYEALNDNSTGGSNSAYGYNAMHSNTVGLRNTAVGETSMFDALSTDGNSAFGSNALSNTTVANYCTAAGSFAGASQDQGNLTTFLGYAANANGAGYVNASALGANASITGSNMVRIGGGGTTSIGGLVAWTNVSDARFKRNVKENVHGLDFILKLKPVTYNLNVSEINRMTGKENILDENEKASEDILKGISEQEKISYSGFIAQDVEATAKSVGYDFSGIDAPKNDKDAYGLRYSEFVVPLVKAIQEQQTIIDEMKLQNDKLKTENAAFKTDIDKIKAQLGMEVKTEK